MRAAMRVRAGQALLVTFLSVCGLPRVRAADVAGEVRDPGDLVQARVESSEVERAFRDPAAVEFIDLGTLEGDESSWPSDINEDGWVVGSSYGAIDYHAVLWKPGAAINRLEAPKGQVGSSAAHVSDDGVILVWSTDHEPFLWWHGQAVSIRAQVPGPVGMNDHADVVGGSQDRLVLWARGRVTEIPGLGGHWSRVVDVNDADTVIGYGEAPGTTYTHPFVWRNGVTRDLGTLPHMTQCDAAAISNSGIVVGTCYSPEASQAYTTRLGVMRALTPPEPVTVYPRGINDLGFVVGTSYGGGVEHAALWTPDGTEIDLKALLPAGTAYDLRYAKAINNRFEIAGAAQVDGLYYHAVLLRLRRGFTGVSDGR